MGLARNVCIGHGTRTGIAFGFPLVGTCRALEELPFVAKEVLEIIVAPLSRSRGPNTLQTTCNGVLRVALAHGVFPTKALLLNRRTRRLGTHVFLGIARSMGLAEGVATGNQGYGFFVVHGHARKRLTNVFRCCQRIRVAIGAFWIDVDQAHLNGC